MRRHATVLKVSPEIRLSTACKELIHHLLEILAILLHVALIQNVEVFTTKQFVNACLGIMVLHQIVDLSV